MSDELAYPYLTLGQAIAPGDEVVLEKGAVYKPSDDEITTHQVTRVEQNYEFKGNEGQYFTVAWVSPIAG